MATHPTVEDVAARGRRVAADRLERAERAGHRATGDAGAGDAGDRASSATGGTPRRAGCARGAARPSASISIPTQAASRASCSTGSCTRSPSAPASAACGCWSTPPARPRRSSRGWPTSPRRARSTPWWSRARSTAILGPAGSCERGIPFVSFGRPWGADDVVGPRAPVGRRRRRGGHTRGDRARPADGGAADGVPRLAGGIRHGRRPRARLAGGDGGRAVPRLRRLGGERARRPGRRRSRLLTEHLDAVVCASDSLAIGAHLAAVADRAVRSFRSSGSTTPRRRRRSACRSVEQLPGAGGRRRARAADGAVGHVDQPRAPRCRVARTCWSNRGSCCAEPGLRRSSLGETAPQRRDAGDSPTSRRAGAVSRERGGQRPPRRRASSRATGSTRAARAAGSTGRSSA